MESGKEREAKGKEIKGKQGKLDKQKAGIQAKVAETVQTGKKLKRDGL